MRLWGTGLYSTFKVLTEGSEAFEGPIVTENGQETSNHQKSSEIRKPNQMIEGAKSSPLPFLQGKSTT